MYYSAIVHLSDLEFGPNNRAMQESVVEQVQDPIKKMAGDLVRDIEECVIRKYDIQRERIGLVITGDIAHSGDGAEYDRAAEFINHIRDLLKNRNVPIAIVPGNHDVNWGECERAFELIKKGSDYKEDILREQMRSHPAKLRCFSEFFEAVLKQPYTPQKAFYFSTFKDLNIALVGIDTTLPCLFSEEDNYGLVREEQIQGAADAIRSIMKGNPEVVSMVAMHHCLQPDTDAAGESRLRYATKTALLIKHHKFRTVLCGHEHTFRRLGGLGKDWSIITAGAFGLSHEYLSRRHREGTRPETNRYCILLIGDKRQKVLYRRLNRMDRPISLGYWEPDRTDGLDDEEEVLISPTPDEPVKVDLGLFAEPKKLLRYGTAMRYVSDSDPGQEILIQGVRLSDAHFPFRMIKSVTYKTETEVRLGDPDCSYQANLCLTNPSRDNLEVIIELETNQTVTLRSVIPS